MLITLILISSIFFIAVMIGLKLIEERRQKKLFFSDLRGRADMMSFKIGDRIRRYLSLLDRENIKLLAAFFGNAVTDAVSGIRRKSKLKKMEFFNLLRTNGNLKKRGSASFFLKNVSEYKGKYIK